MNPRRIMFIGLGLFALLLLATTPMMALAEGDGTELPQDKTADGTARGQRLRLRVDLDGDGYISLREFNSFVNGRLDEETVKRVFNAADKDQDGKLSKREFNYAIRLGLKVYRSQESGSSEESSEDGSGSDTTDSARKNIRQRIRERIRQRIRQRQRSSENDE